MMILGTGILLLYMTVGAFGKGGKGGGGGGKGGGGGGKGGGGDGGDTGLLELGVDVGSSLVHEYFGDDSTTETTLTPTDYTLISAELPSITTYEPSISSSSSASSFTAPVITGGVDLIRLLGPDQRPDIFHLEAVGLVQGLSGSNTAILQGASAVLLALTKSTPDGRWIKSMFDLPGQMGSVNEGLDTVNVTLTSLSTEIKEEQSMKMNRSNLKRLAELGVGRDQIKDPWWPWALIEGALEAGGDWTNKYPIEEAGCRSLLKCFTGQETTSQAHPIDGSYDDAGNGERFAAADHTPILFSQEDNTWGVVMKAPFANDKGEEQIGWAGPWPTEKNNREQEFNSYNATAEFRYQTLVFIDGLPTFEQTQKS